MLSWCGAGRAHLGGRCRVARTLLLQPLPPPVLRQGPITPHRSECGASSRGILTPSPSHLLCRKAAASRLFTPRLHTSALPHRFPPSLQSRPFHAGSPHSAQSRNPALP
eukprot:7064626-Prymnesium_polylepis.1